jgi:hypothetical protein
MENGARFDAKGYWNAIIYNIRVLTGAFLARRLKIKKHKFSFPNKARTFE